MSKTIFLQTLSPVFIGSGAEMQPFEYFFDQGQQLLYRIAPDAMFRYIFDKHPESVEQIHAWIEESAQALDAEKDNQKQSRIRSEFTIFNFVRRKLHDGGLATELEQQVRSGSFCLYSIPCQSVSGIVRKNTGRKQGNRIEEHYQAKKSVALALKTPHHELYIPGSSLKGAIRTAILFRVVRHAEGAILQEIEKAVTSSLNDKRKASNFERWRKEFAEALEYSVFYCGIKDHTGKTRWNDAKCDLMKLIAISDSEAKPILEAGRIAVVDLYQSNGEVQSQTPAVEAIAQGQVFPLRLTLDTRFLLKAKDLLAKNDPHFGKTIWIKFEEKFKRVFGIPLSDLTEDTVAEFEDRVLQQILDACRLHSEAASQRESQLAIKNRMSNLEKFYQVLSRIDGGVALKLGYASGFPGTTIFMAMIANDRLRPLMERILETFRIGKPPKGKGNRKPDLDRFPTSRRYETLLDGTVVTNPLGWIAIGIDRTPIQQKEHPTSLDDPKRSPSPPAAPQTLTAVLPSTGSVPAVVVDNSRRPLKVKIMVQGYENDLLDCGGAGNLSSFPPGTYISVRPSFHPKTNRVQSVTLIGLWKP